MVYNKKPMISQNSFYQQLKNEIFGLRIGKKYLCFGISEWYCLLVQVINIKKNPEYTEHLQLELTFNCCISITSVCKCHKAIVVPRKKINNNVVTVSRFYRQCIISDPEQCISARNERHLCSLHLKI